MGLRKALPPSQPVAPVAVKHEAVTVRRPTMAPPCGSHKRERAPPPRGGKTDRTVGLRSYYLIFTAKPARHGAMACRGCRASPPAHPGTAPRVSFCHAAPVRSAAVAQHGT